MSLLTRAKKAGAALLELVFPRSEDVKHVLAIDPETLGTLASLRKEADTLSLFPYRHPLIKTLIWEMKYRGNRELAEKAALLLYDTLRDELTEMETFSNFTKPILIPIPLSKKKKRERGWNQTELLASFLAATDQGTFFEVRTDLLFKIKETKSQTKMKGKNERKENMRGSFAIRNAANVRDRSIILLDDVITTGATLEEAARVLKVAGARRILKVTVAY